MPVCALCAVSAITHLLKTWRRVPVCALCCVPTTKDASCRAQTHALLGVSRSRLIHVRALINTHLSPSQSKSHDMTAVSSHVGKQMLVCRQHIFAFHLSIITQTQAERHIEHKHLFAFTLTTDAGGAAHELKRLPAISHHHRRMQSCTINTNPCLLSR